MFETEKGVNLNINEKSNFSINIIDKFMANTK
jgi:hypothetical protein